MFKKLVLLFLALAAIAIPLYFYTTNSGFKLQNITWSEPLPIDWSRVNSSLPEGILQQPFQMLGEGHQTYAFVSADGRTVLKFVKFGYMNSMSAEERDARLKRLFNGYLLAYQKDRENTGIIALHQADPQGSPLYVKVDNQTINVTPLYFILQKRGIPLREVLNGNKQDAQKILDQVLDLYADEYRRGLYDSDHNVLYNIGFIEGKPYRLDAGRLKVLPENHNRKVFIKLDLEKILTRMRKWIVKSLPDEQQPHLLKHLQERIDQIALQ